ncbi:MAG: hypothetical protein V4710_19025 [Verrucomicrobiota bacterium]
MYQSSPAFFEKLIRDARRLIKDFESVTTSSHRASLARALHEPFEEVRRAAFALSSKETKEDWREVVIKVDEFAAELRDLM